MKAVIATKTRVLEIAPGVFQTVVVKVMAPKMPRRMPNTMKAKAQYPSVLRPAGALR